MTTYLRRPYKLVTINNQIVPEVLQARTAEGWDLDTPTAEIEVRGPVSYAKWSTVVVIMGASQAGAFQCFTGYLLECDTELYPNTTKILCGGYLSRAQLTVCNVAGGVDLSNSGAGQTDQSIVGFLLDQSGLTTSVVSRRLAGTGQLMGTVATNDTRWNQKETALSCIQRFEDITLGYKTFEGQGTIFRQKISAIPSTSPAYTFTEGVNIFRAQLRDSVRDARNRVEVTGYNNATSTIAYSVQEFSPFVPSGLYLTAWKDSPLIERENTSDPGNGIAGQDVALWWLGEVDRDEYETIMVTPLDWPVRSGMTVQIVSPTRLGQSAQNYTVKHVERNIDRKNSYQQTFTLLSGLGSAGPIQLPPLADFAFTLLEEESVLIAGAQTTIYTVAVQATPGPSSAPISTYAWTTSGSPAGSPASGSLATFVTTFPSLSGATITLQLTDANGLTDSITKSVPSLAVGNWVQRKLYGAGTTAIDDYDAAGTWRVSTQSGATVVANGPLWGAGTHVLTSANDLATSPTSSSPFASGTVTAAWVETDANASNLLIGSSGGQLAYSTNGGSSWTVVSGPDGHAVLRCVLSRSVRGQWFALSAAGLYRTDNFGSGWVTLLAAAGGETFRDFNLSFGPYMVVMAGGRLAVDNFGNTQTFPALTPAVSDVVAVVPDISQTRFYCYDASGRTFYTSLDGGGAFEQMTSLTGAGTPQPRGMWRDGVIRGLLYYANGSDGIYKRIGAFEASPTDYQVRKPGTGNSPVGAVYTQVGVDGLLYVGKVTSLTLFSTTSGKAHSLWNGSSNDSPTAGWTDPGFNDSGWGTPVAVSDSSPGVIAGATYVWSSSPPLSNSEAALFRWTFSLSDGNVSVASLSLQADDWMQGCWINGVYVPGSTKQFVSGVDPPGGMRPWTVSVPTSAFLPGQTNVIAIYAQNIFPSGAWTAFELQVS